MKTILLSVLPVPWVPYAELIRLHKPVGIFNIYFPYLFGCLFAACVRPVSANEVLVASARLLLAAFVLRSMGCAWNDIVDRDVDSQTERCCNRPMARGAISVFSASIFTLCLLGIWLFLLILHATPTAQLYALPVPVMAAIYPFAKRFTSYAQLFLGVTLAIGNLVGAAQLGVNYHTEITHPIGYSLLCLFVAYVVFAVIHDTVYAIQDLRDDQRTGAMSMAVKFADSLVPLLKSLTVLQIVVLTGIGFFAKFGPGFYIITCAGIGLLFGTMTANLDINSPKACWWWFQTASLGFGVAVSLGLAWQWSSTTYASS